jgi:cytochrome P450
VSDWATDYELFDKGFVEDPYPIWDRLRRSCPIAHSERHGGSWMPTTMEDIREIARDVAHFSSREVGVVPRPAGPGGEYEDVTTPPIQSDPPEHTWAKRLILPAFSPQAVALFEPTTRAFTRSLIEKFRSRGHADAAADYAQRIPVQVIALMLGIPTEMSETFTGWVRDILEFAGENPAQAQRSRSALLGYFQREIQARRAQPKDDLISRLAASEVDGKPVPERHIVGSCGLLLVAGIDTTWSSIGSSLWHLATHREDRRRLAAEPELIPTAIEEFLRAYSPVTMARIVTEDVEVGGCPMKAGDRVLLPFPAANRDPEAFEDADRVIIDRERNRHIAFGIGIHRCAGSNLARMELRVALEEWMKAIPEFELDRSRPMLWAGGQVRGPRALPVLFPAA